MTSVMGSDVSAFVHEIERRHPAHRAFEDPGDAQDLEVVIGRRDRDQGTERPVVARKRREGAVAQIAARSGNPRSIGERGPLSEAVVPAVVDDRAVVGAQVRGSTASGLEPAGRRSPPTQGIDDEIAADVACCGLDAFDSRSRVGRGSGAATSPVTFVAPSTLMPGSARTAWRRAHSISGRRTARNTSSSSSERGSPPRIFGRTSSSQAPASMMASNTSANVDCSSLRPRGVNACGCWKCGIPLRSQASESSGSPSESSSRSTSVTRCPSRARPRAAAMPATPAPSTTIDCGRPAAIPIECSQ